MISARRVGAWIGIIILIVGVLLFPAELIHATESYDSGRYIVLVLDTSGTETFTSGGQVIYEAGTAIEYVKDAAKKFLDDIEADSGLNQVAVVSYSTEAVLVSDFTDDFDSLKNQIQILQSGGADRSIADGLAMADELLRQVPSGADVKKNVLLFTTGMTDCGEYSYEGHYNENVIGSSWYNTGTEIHLYAYANIAYETAARLKTGANLYTIGLFQTMDAMPDEGKDVAQFFRQTVEDLSTSHEYAFEVEDPEQLSVAFGYAADYMAADKTDMEVAQAIMAQGEVFSASSLLYDRDMAFLSGVLSLSAEDTTGAGIRNAFGQLGFQTGEEDLWCRNFEGDQAYAIDYADVDDQYVLAIVARGTQTWTEGLSDALTQGIHENFYGYTSYSYFYQYEVEIWSGLKEYLDNHSYLYQGEKPLKIIVTGHSLGGAAANLVAARLTLKNDERLAAVPQEDIYGYTFGGLNSITTPEAAGGIFRFFRSSGLKSGYMLPVTEGFSYIHNVYNFYDSFGPNKEKGKNLLPTIGTVTGKFGQIEMLYENRDEGLFDDTVNHNMPTYLEAIRNNGVDSSKPGITRIVIACPVDVDVIVAGKLVGRVVGDVAEEDSDLIHLYAADDVKYIGIPEGVDYEIEITATDRGTMDYLVENVNTSLREETIKTYEDVALTTGKRFLSSSKSGEEAINVLLSEANDLWEPLREVRVGNGSGLRRMLVVWLVLSVILGGTVLLVMLTRTDAKNGQSGKTDIRDFLKNWKKHS